MVSNISQENHRNLQYKNCFIEKNIAKQLQIASS